MLLFLLAPVTIVLIREPRLARPNLAVWSAAAVQFRLVLRSKTMWTAAALLMFVFMAPGFGIAMNYYQQDVLQFSTTFIGRLQALEGVGSIFATGLYAYLRSEERRVGEE